MEIHYIIIVAAVVIILILQALSLVGTWKRMKLFSKIFGDSKPYEYGLIHDDASNTIGFRVISGGNNNPYFCRINESINHYVKNNESIDFQLLKDTVDANCDSIEDDIHTQIPIPLYLGLAGTMMGIIIGVGYLWWSGTLNALLTIAPTTGSNSTEGIVVLLGGVAIAMICSIVGLVMTTLCTYLFKGCKLSIEQRKSDLFAWLQQNLLPEVATNDLQAIGKISRSLQNFNSTFKQHSETFTRTLQSVQVIMTQQQDLAKTVSQMGRDATEMARANAIATQRLEQNADKLAQFNDYLDSINGYVNEVHRFTENFKEENLRLKALEEIRDFFLLEKREIEERNNSMASKIGKFDDSFKRAMQDLERSMNNETKELQKIIGQRTLIFEEALKEQKKLFETTNKEIISDLQQQFKQLPQAVIAINSLSKVPEQMETLIEKVEKSNNDLIRELKDILTTIVSRSGNSNSDGSKKSESINYTVSVPPALPTWLKWLIVIATVIITCTCVFNSFNTWQIIQKNSQIEVTPNNGSNVTNEIKTQNRVISVHDSIK